MLVIVNAKEEQVCPTLDFAVCNWCIIQDQDTAIGLDLLS